MGTNKAEELIKKLEILEDSCDSNLALVVNGYSSGVSDSIKIVKEYLTNRQSEIDELKLDIAEREKVIDFQKRKMLFTDMTELPSKDSEIEGLIKERDELTKACEYKDRLYKGLNGMLQEKENEVLELTKEVERLKVLNKRLFTLWESLYSPNKLII